MAARQGLSLVLTVDGLHLGRVSFDAVAGPIEALTPYLLPGRHTLRVLCDARRNSTPFTLKEVRIQTWDGADANGNGIKDWADHAVRARSGLDETNPVVASYTSPVCLEGRDPHPSLMQVFVEGADNKANRLIPKPAPDERWYVNVPLTAYADAETIVNVTFQNGALTESRKLVWQPLNLLNGGELTIRCGDSLLFNAKPEGAEDGELTVTVGTNRLSGKTIQPVAYRFDQAGVFEVTGAYGPAQGSPASGSMTVRVVDHKLAGSPACWVGQVRDWDVPGVSSAVVLQADTRMFFEQTATLAGQGRRMSLLIDEGQPRAIVSRLGKSGPILDSVSARGFRVWSGSESQTRLLEKYADGSELIEMLVVVSPLRDDVTFELRTIASGIIFEDGTTLKTLTAADFDAMGVYTVRFIRPASARTSVCYSLYAYQGDVLLGCVR
jgi:hypothetical protein